MGRLLVVEDDEFFSQILREILVDEGHHVTVVENGKAATEKLNQESFDCVLSDVQMPVMSGIELAEWIQVNNLTLPVVLMTGYSELVNTQHVLGKYAIDLIIKPFSDEEVIKIVRRVLDAKLSISADEVAPHSLAKNISKPNEEFAKVPTYALMQGGTADFNLYHFSAGSMIKVISRGEIYSANMAVIRGNKFLFTERESLSKLVSMSILVAKSVGKSVQIESGTKAEIVEDALEIAHQKVSAYGIDAKLVDDCVDMMACYLEAFDDSLVWSLIQRLKDTSESRYGYSMAVTAFALLIAHQRGISIDKCFVLAAAGIFHDIGMSRVNPVLLHTPHALLKMAERVEIERHVELGVEILKVGHCISPEVCEVVLQHHENMLGTGYPHRLRGDQINSLARIIHVVDDFCSLISERPKLGQMSVAKALAQLKEDRRLDQGVVSDLTQLLNSDQEKISA